MVSRGQRAQRRTTTRKRGIECGYCHKIHWGRYRNCWQRARENLQWELQQRQTRHNVGPTTTTAVLQVSGYTSNRHRQFGITRKRLPQSPFVSVTGVLDHQDIAAMLDTGAEFSLISANRLSKDSLSCLKGSPVVTCKGVGGELIQVKGQICRDVQLTGTHLEVFHGTSYSGR